MKTVSDRLASLAEPGYADFQAKLIPSVPREKILGVRLPALRALAKEIKGDDEAAFLAALPHGTLEEDLLHAILVGRERDFAAAVAEVDRFLPFADNWATTDILRPKVFARHADEALPYIRRWLASPLPYVRRAAVGFLMAYYLDGNFDPGVLALPAKIPQEEYYVDARSLESPLIVYLPGQEGKLITDPVSADRLAATLAAMLHIKAPNACAALPLF